MGRNDDLHGAEGVVAPVGMGRKGKAEVSKTAQGMGSNEHEIVKKSVPNPVSKSVLSQKEQPQKLECSLVKRPRQRQTKKCGFSTTTQRKRSQLAKMYGNCDSGRRS